MDILNLTMFILKNDLPTKQRIICVRVYSIFIFRRGFKVIKWPDFLAIVLPLLIT